MPNWDRLAGTCAGHVRAVGIYVPKRNSCAGGMKVLELGVCHWWSIACRRSSRYSTRARPG